MREPIPDPPATARAPEDRLDSWKAIAAYLNRDVTTVQRKKKSIPNISAAYCGTPARGRRLVDPQAARDSCSTAPAHAHAHYFRRRPAE